MLETQTSPYKATYYGMIAYAILCLTAMAPMSIGAAIVICCILFDRGGPRRFLAEICELVPRLRFYLGSSFALILACVASLLSARFYPLSYGMEPSPVSWIADLGKMWYFFFPLALLVGWQRLPEEKQACVLKAWLLSFGLISAIGIPQFFLGVPRAQPNPMLPGYFHPILFLGHHLSVANIWIFPFFAGIETLANSALRKRLGLSLKILIPIMICASFTLVLGYSRTLWVALPIGITLWSLLRLPLKTALIAIAALGVLGTAFLFTPAIQQRLHTEMGVGDRIELWKANLAFFQRRPIFGVGLGKNQGLAYDYFRSLHPGQTDFFIGHAHNVYIELLACTGLAGALAWLAWVGGAIGSLIRNLKTALPLGFVGAALSAWLVFLINGATQVNFWEGKVLHQIMWMTGLGLYWGVVGSRSAPH